MPRGEPFWIGFGDVHDHTARLADIPDLSLARAVIVSGDLTTGGGEAQARRVAEAVRRFNPRLLAQAGNMDLPGVTAYLERQGWNLHLAGLELDQGIGVMGVGCSTFTPFRTPSEVSDEVYAGWLEEAYARIKDYPRFLLVVHDPPYGTRTDALRDGGHVGSRAVREFIERRRPDVCLTGHIHESRAADRIGPTVVVNPGPLSGGGYAVIRRDGQGLTAELRQA